MVYYFGYRPDIVADASWLFSCFRVEATGDHVVAQLKDRQKRDHVSVVLSSKQSIAGALIKSRYSNNTDTIDIPYYSKQTYKEITINLEKVQSFTSLLEWMLQNNIDLNNVSETDEFTLLMLAE